VETKGTNNLSKAGSQYGVFSSLFFISGMGVMVARRPSGPEDDVRIVGPAQSFSTLISGVSVTVAHFTFQWRGDVQFVSPLDFN
jgi:hypothetical protein